ncbi:MAG: N-acetylneuraminate synthase [Rhodocyclaceae bacterium]|nr:N-acetylneuraminate synthase [Rhodocyclaceae bacterium]
MTGQSFSIGGRRVGEGQPCLVIAEAGVNHNGSLDMALRLVDAATEAGADVVKFQTFKTERVVTRRAAKADYQKTGGGDSQTMFEMLKRLELSDDDFHAISEHARRRGIVFMSKGHREDIDFLVGLGVPALKIDSAAVVYYSLLRKAAGTGLPVILSTGGSKLGEVEKALDILAGHGDPPVALLHCTTAYPAPPDQINLRAMLTLKAAFGLPVGFSDHSEGIDIPIAAAALGACIVEKHFTLDRTLAGPDHKASLEPPELRRMVDGIRKVEQALGEPRKRPTELERRNMQLMRRSLVAERDIAAGERLQVDMVTFKRPGTGLGEDFLDLVVGRVAAKSIAAGDPITWDRIGGFADE